MRTFLKLSGYIGPVLLVAAALLFIVLNSYALWIRVLFSLGVVLLTINRFFGEDSDWRQSKRSDKPLTLRRLYRQRCVGVVVLYLSAVLLFLPEGFYYGVYLRRISWLLPFIVFTVIELYSAFRIPAVEK